MPANVAARVGMFAVVVRKSSIRMTRAVPQRRDPEVGAERDFCASQVTEGSQAKLFELTVWSSVVLSLLVC